MKTLEQIKNEYAVSKGYRLWYYLMVENSKYEIDTCVNAVMKIYAMECLKLAYENAEFYQDGDLAVLDYDSITN